MRLFLFKVTLNFFFFFLGLLFGFELNFFIIFANQLCKFCYNSQNLSLNTFSVNYREWPSLIYEYSITSDGLNGYSTFELKMRFSANRPSNILKQYFDW